MYYVVVRPTTARTVSDSWFKASPHDFRARLGIVVCADLLRCTDVTISPISMCVKEAIKTSRKQFFYKMPIIYTYYCICDVRHTSLSYGYFTNIMVIPTPTFFLYFELNFSYRCRFEHDDHYVIFCRLTYNFAHSLVAIDYYATSTTKLTVPKLTVKTYYTQIECTIGVRKDER